MEKFKITLDTITRLNKFVGVCATIKSEVLVKQGRYIVNGASLMGLMSLDLSKELTCEVDKDCIDDLFIKLRQEGV